MLKMLAVWAGLSGVLNPLVMDTQAADICGSSVTDSAGVLDDEAVAEAVAALTTMSSSQTFVVTMDSVGGDPDRWFDTQLAACDTWNDGTATGVKDGVFVVVIAVNDRKTGIYSDDTAARALDGVRDNIATSVMNPYFARGEFTGGVRAGLEEFDRLLAPKQPGLAGTSLTAPETGSRSAADSSSALAVLAVLAATVVLVVATLLSVRKIRSRRRRRAEMAADRTTISEAILRLDGELVAAEMAVDSCVASLPDSLETDMRAQLRDVASRRDVCSAQFAGLSGHDADVAAALDRLARQFSDMVSALANLTLAAQDARNAHTSAMASRENLEAQLSNVRSSINASATTFAVSSLTAQADAADDELKRATVLIAAKEGQEALGVLTELGRQLDELAVTTENLPALLASLPARIDAERRELSSGASALPAARSSLASMQARYGPASWAHVEHLPEQADRALSAAAEFLTRAARLLASAPADVIAASEFVDRASAERQNAAAACEKVAALQKVTATAEAACGRLQREAHAALAAAEQVVFAHPAAADAGRAQLDRAARLMGEISAQDVKADPVMTAARMEQLIDLANAARKSVVRRHEELEALRLKLAQRVAEAERHVRQAGQAVRGAHSGFHSPRSELALRADLDRALTEPDMARQLSMVAAVISAAQSLESAARSYQPPATPLKNDRSHGSSTTWGPDRDDDSKRHGSSTSW